METKSRRSRGRHGQNGNKNNIIILIKYYKIINEKLIKYWDDDLAYVAQKHAERCSFYHDDMTMRSIPGTGKYPGQNIVMTSGHVRMNWSYAFNEMYAGELKRWAYGVGIKKQFFGKTAYHYTQVRLVEKEIKIEFCFIQIFDQTRSYWNICPELDAATRNAFLSIESKESLSVTTIQCNLVLSLS